MTASSHRHVMNIFRLAGDFIHLFSIILLWMKMSRSKSCSGKTKERMIMLIILINNHPLHPTT